MADNDQWLHDADRLDIPGPRKVKRPRVQLDSEKFGQFAEATARFMGTAKFLVYMTVIVCSWVIWNLVAIYKLRFDPYHHPAQSVLLYPSFLLRSPHPAGAESPGGPGSGVDG